MQVTPDLIRSRSLDRAKGLGSMDTAYIEEDPYGELQYHISDILSGMH